jgi:sugar transferase EpsL
MSHSVSQASRLSRPVPALKRVNDLIIGGLMLIVLSPVIAVVAVLIRWRMGRPVLFRQKRPGRGGLVFDFLKFRTMTNAQNAQGVLLPDSQRVTRLGRFLRATSIDELPSLWNVLRGEMSLVGPRPLLIRYLDRYTPEQARRHEVLPGMTGWAQINGRNAVTWEKKFALDIWYIDHWSFWLEWKILLLTLWKALRREGISPADAEFAEEFMGSQT